MMVTTDRNM